MSNEVFPILIVDDEPNIRTGLARALECESYAIATAGDAGEALRQFRITHHPFSPHGPEDARRQHRNRSDPKDGVQYRAYVQPKFLRLSRGLSACD